MSQFLKLDDCPACGGHGYKNGEICQTCEGTGETVAIKGGGGELGEDEPLDQLEHSKEDDDVP